MCDYIRLAKAELQYINCVREKAATLSSMNIDIEDKELAMAVLNGLPSLFGTILLLCTPLATKMTRSLSTKLNAACSKKRSDQTALRLQQPCPAVCLVLTFSDDRTSSGRKSWVNYARWENVAALAIIVQVACSNFVDRGTRLPRAIHSIAYANDGAGYRQGRSKRRVSQRMGVSIVRERCQHCWRVLPDGTGAHQLAWRVTARRYNSVWIGVNSTLLVR